MRSLLLGSYTAFKLRLLIPLLLLSPLFHDASAQTLAVLKEIDPRLEFGVELYANNLVERAKETLLEVVWDEPAVSSDDRAEAYYWLGRIAYNEGNATGAWSNWMKMLEEYPDHPRSVEVLSWADQQVDQWLRMYNELANAPYMWVVSKTREVKYSVDGLELKLTGVGLYNAKATSYFRSLLELDHSAWEGRFQRARVYTDDLPELRRAISSLQDTEAKWLPNESQRGEARFDSKGGLTVGFEEEEERDTVRWYLEAGGSRVYLKDISQLLSLLNDMDTLAEETVDLNPASWFDESFVAARNTIIDAGMPVSGEGIVQAVMDGREDVIEAFISLNVDLNVRDGSGQPALSLAVSNEHINIAQRMINAGVQLDIRDSKGRAPLHASVDVESLSIAAGLLDAGADVDPLTENAFTPLLDASLKGNLPLVRLFVNAGADLNKQNVDGLSPLSAAAFYGHQGIVAFLVDSGADKDLISKDGLTALDWARRRGHEEIVSLLSQ